jgi:hypothetical protein
MGNGSDSGFTLPAQESWPDINRLEVYRTVTGLAREKPEFQTFFTLIGVA